MPISMSTSPDIDLLPLSSVRTLSTPSSPSVRPASARRAEEKDGDKFASPKSKPKEIKKEIKASKSPEKKLKKESEAKSARKNNEEELEIIRETPKTKRLKDTKQTSVSKPKKALDDSEGEKLSEASVTATVERSEKGRLKASRQRTASLSKKEKGETIVKNRSNSAAPPMNSPSSSSFSRSKSTHSKNKPKSKIHKSSTSLVPKERPEEKTFLGAIKRMLEQTWFHGDISKEDADSSLATSKSLEGPKLFSSHGDFLVRLSFSEPVENHPFTITKVNKKGVIFHQRVFHQNGKYTVFTKADGVPEVSADSLINLVKLLTELKIVNQPCKRWNYARKYADIFEKKVSQDGGYLDFDEQAVILSKSAIK